MGIFGLFEKNPVFLQEMRKMLLTVLAAFSAAWFSASAQEVDANLVDAVQLYSSGQAGQARRLLGTLAEAAPGNDAVWYYLALSQNATGEPDAALSSLEKAVALDSTNYWYRYTLGRLYLIRGKQAEGTALFERLVTDFPSRVNPEVLALSGDHYLSEYADSLAVQRYEQALALDGSYAPALLGLSEAYRHQRRYPDYFRTMESFFRLEQIPPQSKGLYITGLARGSVDPKIQQLHRAGFDSLVNLAGRIHPADSSVLGAVGTYYYLTGRGEQAEPWLRKSAELFPGSLTQTATYVQYLAYSKKWERLREVSLPAFERFRELAFLEFVNMADYQLGDFDAIIGNCQYLVSHYAKDKEVCLSAWAMMGDAYHSKGNAASAYKAYEKALRMDPNYLPVLNNYAYYLSLEGRKLKKAYNMSRKTVEAEPDNATYLDTFGWILHLMGRDLEAKPFFKHAMLYGGKDSAVILEHYATVLETLGEADTARVYRNMAKRLDSK